MNTANNAECTNRNEIEVTSNSDNSKTVNSSDSTVNFQTQNEITPVELICSSNIPEVTETSEIVSNAVPEGFLVTSQLNDSSSVGIESCSVPYPKRFTGFIPAKGYVHSIVKPDDLNLLPSSRHTIARSNLGDVTLNLTEFLSYTQRNNYDIIIPSFRENASTNMKVGVGHGYMVLEQQHLPTNINVSSYPKPEFINLSNTSVRHSVLAPNMFHNSDGIQPPAVDYNAPPPYEMPIKLPTYEEVQREKAREGDMLSSRSPQNIDSLSPRALPFLAIDPEIETNMDSESKLLGTNCMFCMAFLFAFVFNWVGFIVLICFCHTVAARYGALAGFGLSLAKWTIIVKAATESEITAKNEWIWWLITVFGVLICVRSMFQYINIRRGWRLMSAATQERLVFLY